MTFILMNNWFKSVVFRNYFVFDQNISIDQIWRFSYLLQSLVVVLDQLILLVEEFLVEELLFEVLLLVLLLHLVQIMMCWDFDRFSNVLVVPKPSFSLWLDRTGWSESHYPHPRLIISTLGRYLPVILWWLVWWYSTMGQLLFLLQNPFLLSRLTFQFRHNYLLEFQHLKTDVISQPRKVSKLSGSCRWEAYLRSMIAY